VAVSGNLKNKGLACPDGWIVSLLLLLLMINSSADCCCFFFFAFCAVTL
jgi:hypothetical protein